MPLPDATAVARLNVTEFRKGAQAMLTDLRAIQEVAKKVGTIKITADLSAGKSLESAAARARAAIESIAPSDMQRRIDTMFGAFNTGLGSAKASAAAFEAEAATVRAQINQLSNAVTIARNKFQQGFGEATPEEIAQLTQEMNRLTAELNDVGVTATRVFGQYSNEMVKVERANRLAQTTAAAARGEITRLGLASQVKLGAGAALQEYGAQAGFAANGLLQVTRFTDQARISQKLFEIQLKNNGVALDQGRAAAKSLADTLKLTDAESEGFIGRLVRQGLSAEKAAEALARAGASAKLVGRSTAEGAENFVSAVEAGDSAMLASIGISENLSTFYAAQAKELNKKADDLTKAEKAQAAYNLAIAAASDELALYKQSQDGLTGSTTDLELQTRKAQEALGQALLPTATNGTDLILKFTDAYNGLPPIVQTGTAVLLASTVALGLLATPITSLITLWQTLTASMASRAAAQGVEAVATGTTLLNRAQLVQKFLLTDVSVLYARANAQAMLYSGSLGANSAAMNVFSASATRATGALTAFTAAISIYTVAATAALALGLYWAQQVKETTAIYEQSDEMANKSFENIQARIQQLNKSGTELDRARARVLTTQQALQQAQEAPIKGVNILTGQRIYGEVDEARMKQLQGDLVTARDNVTRLYTEAQRRGVVNLKLTEDQTKAVKALNQELTGRKFDLSLTGMSEMGADLARVQQQLDKVRQEFKAPFTVKGVLMDPAQTPALREGLAQLDAQLAAEQAATREKYAKKAADAAKRAALDTQAVEIAAMQDGVRKRAVQREAEIAQIQREAKETADQYADFPKQQQAIEEEARRTVAVRRRQWAREDQELARQRERDITEVEVAARDAQVAAMAEGRLKKEAVRAGELEDLRRSIDEKVRALAGDPEAQAAARASGQTQISARIQEQARQRAEEERDAQRQVLDAQRAARDAQLAALGSTYEEENRRREAQRQKEVEDVQRSAQDRIRALNGYAQAQADVARAAQDQVAAITARGRREDEEAARAYARRIADAWIKAQAAERQAQQAGREARLAEFNLTLSRQLVAAQGNAEEVARLELRGVQERARLADETARAGYDGERRALRESLDRALEDTRLSASERRALWMTYYADLNRLGLSYEASERQRQQQLEQDLREAQARLALTPAQQAVQGADDRAKEAQWMRDLADSTQDQLTADRALLTAHRQRLAALQEVLATTERLGRPQEEVKAAADAVAEAQHQISVDLKSQLDLTRQLARESYQRQQADAKFAEDTAVTDAQLFAARQRQLTQAQARQRELAGQLTTLPEGTARDGVLGEWRQAAQDILDLQTKINAMPAEAEQRRVTLLQAQRTLLLEQQGLAGSGVAQAQANAQAAQEEYAAAQRRLTLARTESDQDAARADLTQKRTAVLAAQRDVIKALNEEENKTLDVQEAQARAQLELRDLADDAVASAQLDLQVTQAKLALLGDQLARGGLNQQDTLDLQRQQIDLTAEQARQGRALAQAQRDRADLLQAITRTQRDLALESQGGVASTRALQSALSGIADAREAITRAERDYQRAQASGTPEVIRAATEALTTAIKGQRDAVRALADQYRQQITSMQGVQDAAERLKQAAYGDAGQPFQASREYDRIQAIQARRDAAQKALAVALQGGQADQISKAADDLAKQEERYQKQTDLIEKNGRQVTRTGEATTRRLADQVDALGIQYDRETLAVQERARIADQEAEAVISYGGYVGQFREGVQTLAALPPLRLETQTITARLDQASLDALRGFRPDPASVLTDQAQRELWQRMQAPSTAPVTNISNVWNVENIIHAAPGQNIDQLADRVLSKFEDKARRLGRSCPK